MKVAEKLSDSSNDESSIGTHRPVRIVWAMVTCVIFLLVMSLFLKGDPAVTHEAFTAALIGTMIGSLVVIAAIFVYPDRLFDAIIGSDERSGTSVTPFNVARTAGDLSKDGWFCYFVSPVSEGGIVKVVLTSDIGESFADMCRSTRGRLRVISIMPGSTDSDAYLRMTFSMKSFGNGWYHMSDDIQSFIGAANSLYGEDEDVLAQWAAVGRLDTGAVTRQRHRRSNRRNTQVDAKSGDCYPQQSPLRSRHDSAP
ncbi:MAG: hypothetical protein R2867_05435 [Caldilineaceae bacterium]